MMIEKKAYAKVNLYLKILGKDENNYHRLFTVMHTLPIYDTLCINIRKEKEKVSGFAPIPVPVIICSDREIPTGMDNTVCKSVQLYFSHIADSIRGEHYAIDIHIEKRIPSQAGLGGGSSDAAAVLLALNEFFDGIVEESTLINLATKVGADVPFFVKTQEKIGTTAICEGIGEIVTPIYTNAFDRLRFDIIKPKCGISTKEAFEIYDCMQEHRKNGKNRENTANRKYNSANKPNCKDTEQTAQIFQNGSIKDIAEILHNDFEDVVFPLCKDIEAAKSELINRGAVAAMLSGSGSAVFGIFI